MNEIKREPAPAPWKIVDREVLEDGSVYPRHIVGGPFESEVCFLEGRATAELAIKDPDSVWGRPNANGELICAAPDMALALEMIAAEDDAARHNGTPLLTSGVRMTLDAALIKAGRKEAPVPVRHFTIAGVNDD
ncbi:hypothetical protein [Burkholderia multivorans]|uniref:hypothetical protein n=1 Tax=Burkholderia multivorans TaxID=87883 RepID=UPI0021C09DD7|nr:hypothetical protein [Burkholderia multivorans]